MPGNTRFEWHARVSAVEREYRLIGRAADFLMEAVGRGEVRLDPHRPRDLRDAADNLEASYLVRLYAVFEAALRSYWTAEVRETRPPAEVLIDQVAKRAGVPPREAEDVHAVRLSRNALVHDDAEPATEIEFATARMRLQAYLKRLPDEW